MDDTSTSTPTRRHQPVEVRREQLLDAAVSVMRAGGVAAATTRAVTAQAGLPHGAFHYCFDSKEELVAAILQRELTASLRETWSAVDSSTDVTHGLTAALTAYVDHVRQRPGDTLLLDELTLTAARTDSLAHLPRWEHTQYVDHVRDMLETWTTTAGLHWSVPLAALAEALVAATSGLARSWLASRDDTATAAAVDAVARGLAALAEP